MKFPSVFSVAVSCCFLPNLIRAQSQKYFTNAVNERAISCPLDPNQVGYKHVIDVNVDQQSELDRIAAGQPARGPYVFPFCNNFKYLMEQEVLKVLLDDVKFVCGYNGTNEELCVFEGNDVQVEIPENKNNVNVEFEGISFYGFTGVSTKAYAAGTSKVTFRDTSWHNFHSGAVAVHQWLPPQGGVPMEVEIEKATFRNGTGSNVFDNVGGVLKFTDMTLIEDIQADSMIRTSARGTTNLATVKAQMSDITRLTHTLGASKQTVFGVNVTQMKSIGSVFYVENAQSELTVTNVTVIENRLLGAYQGQVSRNFNLLIATDSSTATINDVVIKDCDGVDRIFSANDGATVNVMDATVERVQGTQPPDLLSNIAMSEDGGNMNVLRLKASDVTSFGAAFFAICGSYIQVKQSCVMNGRAAAPVFISSDSDFTSDGNYINVAALTVDRCLNNKAASVFFETSIQDQCFSNTGTGTCNGQCKAGFTEASECMIDNPASEVYELVPRPAPGGSAGNPSCPASPPTPVPTLPPFAVAGGGAGAGNGAGQPQSGFGTIPPGNPGAPGSPGSPGSPGGSGSGSGGGGGGGNGGQVFDANNGFPSGVGSIHRLTEVFTLCFGVGLAVLLL